MTENEHENDDQMDAWMERLAALPGLSSRQGSGLRPLGKPTEVGWSEDTKQSACMRLAKLALMGTLG